MSPPMNFASIGAGVGVGAIITDSLGLPAAIPMMLVLLFAHSVFGS